MSHWAFFVVDPVVIAIKEKKPNDERFADKALVVGLSVLIVRCCVCALEMTVKENKPSDGRLCEKRVVTGLALGGALLLDTVCFFLSPSLPLVCCHWACFWRLKLSCNVPSSAVVARHCFDVSVLCVCVCGAGEEW